MGEHKHNEHEKSHKHPETFAERDPLAAEEPDVLESSASDPEFPAMQEFEVDRGGPKANTRKHPGAHLDHRRRRGHHRRSASRSPPPATG